MVTPGAILLVLGILLALSVTANVYLFIESRQIQRELLDRLMARDFVEYQGLAAQSDRPKLRRFSMNDEREAEIEKKRKEAVVNGS